MAVMDTSEPEFRERVMIHLERGMTELGKYIHQGQRGIWISERGPQVGHIRSLDSGDTADFLKDGESVGSLIRPREFIPGWYIRAEGAVQVAGMLRAGMGILTTQKEHAAYAVMKRRAFVDETSVEPIKNKKTSMRVTATLTPLWLYIESFHSP